MMAVGPMPRDGLPPLLLGIAALAAIGLADCALLQLISGDFAPATILRWSLATLLPLAVGAAAISLFVAPRISRRMLPVALAAATLAVLVILVAADLIAFPASSAEQWLERARSKAPGAAAFVGLGAAVHWGRSRAACGGDGQRPPYRRIADLAAHDRAAVAAARTAHAAGNYVELRIPGARTRLIRMPIGHLAAVAEADGLIRLHRSMMVRRSAIAAWRNDRSGLVAAELDDGTVVRIGRNYRAAAYRLRNACGWSQSS